MLALHEFDLSYNVKNASECMDTNYFNFKQTGAQIHLKAIQELIFGVLFMVIGFIGVLPGGKK